MPWRPSADKTIQRDVVSGLWQASETVFNLALSSEPLPRGKSDRLLQWYVRERRFDQSHEGLVAARLPPQFDRFHLGPTDVDVIDFILNYENNRVLQIRGSRGAGKTTLVNFVECVIREARLDLQPVLLILNGLRLPQDATHTDFIQLLITEIQKQLPVIPEELREGFQYALGALSESPNRDGMLRALDGLVERLPEERTRLVTLVFDNLDHHRVRVVDRAVDLAKEVYTTTNIGSIICIREGTGLHVMKSSSAGAFFGFVRDVNTPSIDAWMASIEQRVIRAAETLYARRKRVPLLYELDLTPERLGRAFRNFSGLLREYRRGDDDAFRVLEAVSANDTRHLIRLLKRILSNRHLPDRWLLGIETEGEPDYHPLSSLVEGPNFFFRGDNSLPNLLCYTDSVGNIELLLLHRILTLLDSSVEATPTERLFRWLAEFAIYDEPAVLGCLKRLSSAHLISSSDSEVISDDEPLPSDLYLTQAGAYYLHYLLHYADYLAFVVVDIPLEHSLIRTTGGSDSFAPRLMSLGEYSDEVRRREDRQITELSKRPPSPELRRVAEALSKGGLLSHALADGLREALQRGRHAKSHLLADVLPKVTEILKGLETFLRTSDDRLQGIINRGRRALAIPARPFIRSEDGLQVRVDLGQRGDDLSMSVRVNSPEPTDTMLVVVKDSSKRSFFQAVPVKSTDQEGEGNLLTGSMKDVVGGTHLHENGMSVSVLSLQNVTDRTALLSVDEDNDQLRVRLYSLRDGSSFDLGNSITTSELKKWSMEQLLALGSRVASGAPFADHLRTIGTELCIKVLSQAGQHLLAAHYNLLDTVVICCNQLEIPWELMCPPPSGMNLSPMIGDVWRIFRWPANPLDGGIAYLLSDPRSAAGALVSVGLPPESHTWRAATPRELGGLRDLSQKAGTLHLIGHWNADGAIEFSNIPSDRFDAGRCSEPAFALEASTARAHPLIGPRTIIISSCGAAAITPTANLPLALSLPSRGKRVIWAPLIAIREADADTLDYALAQFTRENPSRPIEDFMRSERDRLPLLRLYVRYGLSRL